MQELAQITIQKMIADNAIEAFLNSDEQGRVDLAMAYAEDATKIFDRITTKVLSSPAKLDAVSDAVWSNLTAA